MAILLVYTDVTDLSLLSILLAIITQKQQNPKIAEKKWCGIEDCINVRYYYAFSEEFVKSVQ